MEKYKIYHSQRFKEELNKFDEDFQNKIDNIEEKLVENPYSGKPLGVKWFND